MGISRRFLLSSAVGSIIEAAVTGENQLYAMVHISLCSLAFLEAHSSSRLVTCQLTVQMNSRPFPVPMLTARGNSRTHSDC
jgi:hypothetical protein